jgi:uncharacterized protein (DUF486 family)
MNDLKLIGKSVLILGEAFHPDFDQEIAAKIIFTNEQNNHFVMSLDKCIQIGGNIFQYVVASPRSGAGNLTTFSQTKEICCSMIFVPQELFSLETPFDVTWWRGKAAILSDVLLG